LEADSLSAGPDGHCWTMSGIVPRGCACFLGGSNGNSSPSIPAHCCWHCRAVGPVPYRNGASRAGPSVGTRSQARERQAYPPRHRKVRISGSATPRTASAAPRAARMITIYRAPRKKIAPTGRAPQNCLRMIRFCSRSDS
jgi:hypothetical protein